MLIKVVILYYKNIWSLICLLIKELLYMYEIIFVILIGVKIVKCGIFDFLKFDIIIEEVCFCFNFYKFILCWFLLFVN